MEEKDVDKLVEEICRAHKKFCGSRKVNMNFCGGMTVENMPHKCKGCPYNSEWSCLVKFALQYGSTKAAGFEDKERTKTS